MEDRSATARTPGPLTSAIQAVGEGARRVGCPPIGIRPRAQAVPYGWMNPMSSLPIHSFASIATRSLPRGLIAALEGAVGLGSRRALRRPIETNTCLAELLSELPIRNPAGGLALRTPNGRRNLLKQILLPTDRPGLIGAGYSLEQATHVAGRTKDTLQRACRARPQRQPVDARR